MTRDQIASDAFDKLFDSLTCHFDGRFLVGTANDCCGAMYHVVGDGPISFQALPEKEREIHIRVLERTYVVPGNTDAVKLAATCLRQYAGELRAIADKLDDDERLREERRAARAAG